MKALAPAVVALALLAGCGVAGPSALKRDPRIVPAARIDFIPRSVSFLSPSLGWAWGPSGARLGAPTAPGVLAQTKDGGRDWSAVLIPGRFYAPTGVGSGVSGVRFATPRQGYLFGSQLWMTADGGAHWRRVHTPGPILDLETGAGSAYALVLNCATVEVVLCDGHPEETARLYSVTTGGLERTGLRASVDVGWESLVVRGATIYLLTPTPEGPTFLRPATLWVSHDRGASWRELSAPCVWDGAAGGALAAWSSSGLALACGYEPATANQTKMFYLSTDGGAHWQQTGLIRFGPRHFSSLAGGYITSLAAAGRQTWALAEGGDAGWILVTHNSGHTWRFARFTGPYELGAGWDYVAFTDRLQAVATPLALNGELVFTRDGGDSWEVVAFGR